MIQEILSSIRKMFQSVVYRDYYHDSNLVPYGRSNSKDLTSPSGKFRLEIFSAPTSKDCWNLTMGKLFWTEGNQCFMHIKRNYSHFWHCWVKQDDNEYLVCGEDYQGLTVIHCNTGERVDYIPGSASRGAGFCHTEAEPSECGKKLRTQGCTWGGPFIEIEYDISKIMSLPWPILHIKHEDQEDDQDD